MTTKDTGGSAFKVGDRVEVIAVAGNDEDFFAVGATGAITKIDSDGCCWVDFDSGAKDSFGSTVWCTRPSQLAARKEES